VRPGVRVLLVGINPSLYSAAVGRHFARPGNRLWRTLHEAGFTDRQLDPSETAALTRAGLGITNLVAGATARADQVPAAQLRDGVRRLAALVERRRPAHVAVLGITAFRLAFDRPGATVGMQRERLVDARLWMLPNPSGLNAGYQQPALTAAYAQLRRAAFGAPDGPANLPP
jgi:TDG/mug DNA glycosylase family protein